MDEFRVDHFMKSFEIFLEELSNWYVRRSRRRFWKSEDDQDKHSAYASLYHVLTHLVRSIAPVLPFVSETIYQNLVVNSEVDAIESVHLCDYPDADESWIDLDLIKNVDALKLCSAYNVIDASNALTTSLLGTFPKHILKKFSQKSKSLLGSIISCPFLTLKFAATAVETFASNLNDFLILASFELSDASGSSNPMWLIDVLVVSIG